MNQAKFELLKLLSENDDITVSSTKSSMVFNLVKSNLPKVLAKHPICIEIDGRKFELDATGSHDANGDVVISLLDIKEI